MTPFSTSGLPIPPAIEDLIRLHYAWEILNSDLKLTGDPTAALLLFGMIEAYPHKFHQVKADVLALFDKMQAGTTDGTF